MSRFFQAPLIFFIIFSILSRFVPHPPNFTAINAVILASALMMKSLNRSLLVLFASLLISDLFLGLHLSLFFVWLAFAVVAFTAHFCVNRGYKGIKIWFLPFSSLLFFIVSNFGSWIYSPYYPKTFEGLTLCYTMALPFLSYQMMGDLFYGVCLFGLYSIFSSSSRTASEVKI